MLARMTSMLDIELVNGSCKPTNISEGHHIVGQGAPSLTSGDGSKPIQHSRELTFTYIYLTFSYCEVHRDTVASGTQPCEIM